MGRAMVWSPPMVSTFEPSLRRSVTAASMVSIASAISNGFTAISPQSATCCTANGSIPTAGLYGRNSFDEART